MLCAAEDRRIMKFLWLISFAAFMLLSGCSTGYRLGDGATLGDYKVSAAPDELRFTGRYGYLAFKPNSAQVRIDDAVNLILPCPMRCEDGKYVLEKRVLDLVVAPLLLRRPVRAGVVMLDPGHGGSDSGAPGSLVPEKALNLAVALKLKTELEKRNFKVLTTRSRDVAISLGERVRAAADSKADLYVSIHHDSAVNRNARGYSVYAPRTCSMFPGESTALAAAIQREIVKLPEVTDRGVRFADFHVLRAPMPAVLVELGFISNPDEERLMNDPDRQAAEAAAIAAGIVNYRAGTGKKKP